MFKLLINFIFVLFILNVSIYSKEVEEEISKHAILIGIDNYREKKLSASENSVKNLSKELEKRKFQVTSKLNLSKSNFEEELIKYRKDISEKPCISIFYFTGMGVQTSKGLYLVPDKAVLNEKGDIPYNTVSLQMIFSELELLEQCQNVVLFDTYFVTPFSLYEDELVILNKTPSDFYVSFSSIPGVDVNEIFGFKNLFTNEFIKSMKHSKKFNLRTEIDKIRNTIFIKSGHQTIPLEFSTLTKEIILD